jgi:aspartate/methionine/tyrosine aminotransferase
MTMMGRELAAKGVKVVSLASGEPDFPTPPHAIEARTAPRARATPSTRRRTARGR